MKINNTAVFSQQFQITSYKEQISRIYLLQHYKLKNITFLCRLLVELSNYQGTFLDSVVNHLLV